MGNDVYLKIYDQIALWVPEGHEIILPEDEFNYMGFDSIDMAELLMWAEDEFGVDIPEAKIYNANIKTVGGFASFIESIMEVFE